MKMSVETCCSEHDKQYSLEGILSRREADHDLWYCLAMDKENPRPLFAYAAWLIVRGFGWVFYHKKV